MYAKFVILLLAGCALTLAQSKEESESHGLLRRQPRGIIFDTIGSWIKTATDIAIYPYKKTFQIFVETTKGITDYGLEKVQQVMQKYYDIRIQYQKNVDEIKNDIIRRAIGELQNVVNFLADQANVKTCENIKQSHQELAESGMEALEKLEHDLKAAVDDELKSLQDELDNWQIEADQVVKENQKNKKKKLNWTVFNV